MLRKIRTLVVHHSKGEEREKPGEDAGAGDLLNDIVDLRRKTDGGKLVGQRRREARGVGSHGFWFVGVE